MFSYNNGKDYEGSTIKMTGRLKDNITTPDVTWKHSLKGKTTGSYLFHYQTGDKAIPLDAAIEDGLRAMMKVKLHTENDKDKTKMNIVGSHKPFEREEISILVEVVST